LLAENGFGLRRFIGLRRPCGQDVGGFSMLPSGVADDDRTALGAQDEPSYSIPCSAIICFREALYNRFTTNNASEIAPNSVISPLFAHIACVNPLSKEVYVFVQAVINRRNVALALTCTHASAQHARVSYQILRGMVRSGKKKGPIPSSPSWKDGNGPIGLFLSAGNSDRNL
jgi:hypothetical protein